ncbi:MAG: biopolymer transporter ExbD [Bacteroidia bacterium]|nr:biopolymer transporter ExbD [Bacteroidia bacterium]
MLKRQAWEKNWLLQHQWTTAEIESLENKNDDIKLAMKAGGELFWNREAISREELEIRLINAAKLQPVPELHLHADRNLDYGKIADIMALSSRSGVSKIAFVSEPTGDQP